MIIQDALDIEQGSDEWRKARLGHVSASSIAAVMAKGAGKTRQSYLEKIVAERLTQEIGEGFSNASMEWGTQTEPQARMAYEVSCETFVTKTGFHKHPTIEWVGVSPDGLLDAENALVEIKCPNTTTHLSYIKEGKCPVEYYKQIQCQLWVTGRAYCDFISYDPRLKNQNLRLFVIKVKRDEELIAEMESEVIKFLADVEKYIKELP
jgi:putative phage-type endonuclease